MEKSIKNKTTEQYFWGKYKESAVCDNIKYQLLLKQTNPDGEEHYYTFAWDCPLRDLDEFSKIIPANLITPDGVPYGD